MTESIASVLLDRALSLAISVGYADPAEAPAAVRLPCLSASGRLRLAGGTPSPVDDALDPEARIAEALAALASLPLDLFGDGDVLMAAAHLRRAYEAI